MMDKTWQELFEQCVQDFVAACRAQYEEQRSLNGKPFRFIQTGGKHHH
jgi:hypothetical protein